MEGTFIQKMVEKKEIVTNLKVFNRHIFMSMRWFIMPIDQQKKLH